MSKVYKGDKGFVVTAILIVLGIVVYWLILSPVKAQQPPLSLHIQVNGRIVLLELGKNVHPQTYAVLLKDPTFASGVDWVFMDNMWIPLSRGVEMPSEESLSKAPPPPGPEYIPECRITLSVPVYGQCWSPWSNQHLFNDSTCPTMCQAGCAVTSATMIFRYFGANKDPGEVNSCSGNNGCRSGCLLAWGCAADHCSDNKARWIDSYSFYWAALCGLLSQDRPPIVHLVKGNNSHFVVVYKSMGYSITDPNDYYINDPLDGTNYKKLAAYTNNGWSAVGIREYARR